MLNFRYLLILVVAVATAVSTSGCISAIYLDSTEGERTPKVHIPVDTVLINDDGDIAIKFVKDDRVACLVAERSSIVGTYHEWVAKERGKYYLRNEYFDVNLSDVFKGKTKEVGFTWKVRPYPPWPPDRFTTIHNVEGQKPFRFSYPLGPKDVTIALQGYYHKKSPPWVIRAIPLIVTVPLDVVTFPVQMVLVVTLGPYILAMGH